MIKKEDIVEGFLVDAKDTMMFNDGCEVSQGDFPASLFVFAMVLIYTNDKYLLRLLSSDFIFGEIMRL